VNIDGRDVQPVRFRRCVCGHPMDVEVTREGRALVRRGWSVDDLARIAAENHAAKLRH